MIVLGIDPGSTSTGFGVLRLDGGRMAHIDSGAIRPSRRLPFPDRLKHVYAQFRHSYIRFNSNCYGFRINNI